MRMMNYLMEAGCRMPEAGYLINVLVRWARQLAGIKGRVMEKLLMLDTGCCILDAGYRTPGNGYWLNGGVSFDLERGRAW